MRTEGKYHSFPHKNFKPQGREGRSSMINSTYAEYILGYFQASGTGSSDTASRTDPVSGSRHPGTFPARREESSREGSFRAGEGAILGPGSLRDQSAQVSSQTAKGKLTAEATQLQGQTLFGFKTSGHLPHQRRGVCPGGL